LQPHCDTNTSVLLIDDLKIIVTPKLTVINPSVRYGMLNGKRNAKLYYDITKVISSGRYFDKLKYSRLYVRIWIHFAASKESQTFSSVFVLIFLRIELTIWTGWDGNHILKYQGL